MKKEVNRQLKVIRLFVVLDEGQEQLIRQSLEACYQRGQINLLLKNAKKLLKETKKQYADTAPIYEK